MSRAKIFPVWPKDVEDPRVDNLIGDILDGTLDKSFWDISKKKKAQKKQDLPKKKVVEKKKRKEKTPTSVENSESEMDESTTLSKIRRLAQKQKQRKESKGKRLKTHDGNKENVSNTLIQTLQGVRKICKEIPDRLTRLEKNKEDSNNLVKGISECLFQLEESKVEIYKLSERVKTLEVDTSGHSTLLERLSGEEKRAEPIIQTLDLNRAHAVGGSQIRSSQTSNEAVRGHTANPNNNDTIIIGSQRVFKRPSLDSFLEFCLKRFDVAIWTSKISDIGKMISEVMGKHESRLLFTFNQEKCIKSEFATPGNKVKPLFLKDLRVVWDDHRTLCYTCCKHKYDASNTLLVDDSPEKAVCNPPHTGVFPLQYTYTNRKDSALGPERELRSYLERLADAENVREFVAKNPYGQTAITETHKSWESYSKILESHKKYLEKYYGPWVWEYKQITKSCNTTLKSI